MVNTNVTKSHTVADKMKIDIDVFGPLVLYGIACNVRGRHIVTIDDGGMIRWVTKLMQELAQPAGLGNTICDATVFGLGSTPRDSGLPLRGPGQQVMAEKHTEPGGGLARVRTAGPIGVGISQKVEGGGLVQLQAIVCSATEISQDAFDELHVRITRCMHE